MKSDVLKEEKWLKKESNVPRATCSYPKEHLASYFDKIFNTPNNHSVLTHNPCILASDLATIAGTGWLNSAIINVIAEMLHKESEHTAALLLNNVIIVNDNDLADYVRCEIRNSIKHVILFANVGKSKLGEVFISRPGNPGCHWTLLYIDLTVNKCYYCDTYCWGMPKHLNTEIGPLMNAIYQEIDLTPKPLSKNIEAHVGGMGSSTHLCSKACLNIPAQTCANVCGVAAAMLGAVACTAPELWKNVFLKRNTDLPTSLKWLLPPSTYSDFLRCTIISWLLTNCIDVAAIGINREAIPRQREDIAPSRCRRVADTVIISDDECTNENKHGKETTDAHVESKSEDAKNERACKEPTTNRQPTKSEVLSGEGKGRKKTKREESGPEQERIVNTFRRNE